MLNLNNGTYCQKRAQIKKGKVNSMRIMISTLNSEGSTVKVLGGLVAFRPVPSVGEWVFCLLLLRDGETDVRVSGDVCVGYFDSVVGLSGNGSEVAGGGGFLDEEEIEECNKQDKSGERFEHESQSEVQGLSFCQRLIQLWLRSRLKQQCLLSKGT